ncbi:MAG: trypsin-like peptidase domain-containing protein [bacterium]
MTLELRVLSGTRAGTRERFDKSIVSVGRHGASDLRFDPQTELDVSTRHAELRSVDGVWSIHDLNSTNGTYVNGERIAGAHRLREGDVVSLGVNGPRVEVHGISDGGDAVSAPRMDTSMRVAVAVEKQTKAMRRKFTITGSVLVAAGVIAFALWQRQVIVREREMAASIARSESTLSALQVRVGASRPGDAAYAAALREELDARKRDLAYAREQIKAGTATTGTVSELSKKLDRTALMQQSISQMDVSHVVEQNDAAVAMLASDFDGKFLAGTAFGITRGGLLITNKHVVRSESGASPQRLVVIFANTKKWLPARVVRVSDVDDLALLQIEGTGTYPVVAGVSRDGARAKVGAPVASIGYPGAIDTPMEGTGMNITARTTSTPGTVSKRLSDVIQIDSYAGHGSSGSPLFDAAGSVVGVIYGGAAESNGRIVYAVPAEKLVAFLAADGGSIVR